MGALGPRRGGLRCVLAGRGRFASVHDLTWPASGRNATRRKRRAIAIHYAGAADRYLGSRWTRIEGLRDGDPLASALPIAVRAHRTGAPARAPGDRGGPSA